MKNTDFKAFGQSLNSKTIKKVQVPVPTPAIQKEIVEKLDKYYSSIQIKNFSDPKEYAAELKKIKENALAILKEFI